MFRFLARFRVPNIFRRPTPEGKARLPTMGITNAFRKVWSSSPPRTPPRRPRPGRRPHQLSQEQLVISSYRDHLHALAQSLNSTWQAFDAEPDDFTLVHQLRQLRHGLTPALESYHAALGARDNTHVDYVLAAMENTDQRLVFLDQQVLAEVDRFEYASLDIAARYAAAIHPLSKSTTAADAHDVLIELELYRDSWATVMDIASQNRLDHAHRLLREIVDAQPSTSSHSFDYHSPSTHPVHPQAGTPGSTVTPGACPPATPPDRPHRSRSRPFLRTQKTPTSPPPPRPSPPPVGATDGRASPEREYASSESGDDGPMQMVISRSRTLRDVAEVVMSTSEQDAAKLRADPGMSSSRISPSPGTSLEQPNLSTAKNMSFASTLYHTRHARVDAISDAGIMLRRSNVRGDGRCMFRALARVRIVAAGSPIPSERVEKDAADELRHRAVAELRKQRHLLARFFVIEGNFDQYTKKMSYSRTYGGEPELLMLAKLLHVPIAVYIQKDGAYRQIQVYGKQYRGDPMRILYSDGVHYDALLASTYARA